MKTTGRGKQRDREPGWPRRTRVGPQPGLLVACCAGPGPRHAVFPEITPKILDRMNRIATYLWAARILKTHRFGGPHDRA